MTSVLVNHLKRSPKGSVCVSKLSCNQLLIRQTTRTADNDSDLLAIDGEQERRVDINDDAAIARAVRDGLDGTLPLVRPLVRE